MAPKLQRRARPDRSAETAKRQKQRRASAKAGERPDRSAETKKRSDKRSRPGRDRTKRKESGREKEVERRTAARWGERKLAAAAAEKEEQRQAKAAAEQQAAALRAAQAAADKANWAKLKAAKMSRRRRGCRPQPGDDLISSEEAQ